MSALKNFEEMIDDNIREILNMKEDIVSNFDSIQLKIEENNFSEILSYFKEKVKNLKLFEKNYKFNNPFPGKRQNINKLGKSFKTFYQNLIFSYLPIPQQSFFKK